MRMSFDFGVSLSNLLFHGFDSHSIAGMIGMFASLFCLAFLNEALKRSRCWVEWNDRQSRVSDEERRSLANSGFSDRRSKTKQLAKRSLVSGLYFTQTVLNFLVMLAVMSFSAWIFLAVVLGSGTGYFVFNEQLVFQSSKVNTRNSYDTTADADVSVGLVRDQQQGRDTVRNSGSRENVVVVDVHNDAERHANA